MRKNEQNLGFRVYMLKVNNKYLKTKGKGGEKGKEISQKRKKQ